jgi:tRNA threonylcarbamoyladenosine biosynthesis protein TsaB
MAHIRQDTERLPGPVILALETATMCGSVALVAENRCLGEFTLQTGETHSRRLLAGIDWLLQESGIGPHEIDAVAVSLGPGSFTGLRICLATAKGLTLALGTRLIGVGTLDGLAAQVAGAGTSLVCPVLDARKKEVYCGLYRGSSEGVARLRREYLVLPPEDLCGAIDEPVLLLGDGATAYEGLFRERLAGLAMILPAALYFPRAASIGMLALEKWQREEFIDPAGAQPIYVRPSEAELLFGG